MSARLWLLMGALGSSALAEPYDLSIYQLGNPNQCSKQGADGSCLKAGTGYLPSANAHFRAFARRLAAALTSVNLAPPATLGHSGFAISAELSAVDFQKATTSMDLPTHEPIQGLVLLPSIHVRKGLPFSFEVGARAAWFERSRMGAATLELKWALNEGFAYTPDIAVRGHLTRLLNARDFELTTWGADVAIGKQFALGGMVGLTPYVGWDLVFVGATSGNVDFNPRRTLAEADQADASFTDYYPFDPVAAEANANNRFYGGFRLIAGALMLGFELSYTVLGSFIDPRSGTTEMAPVPSFNWMLGFDF